MAPLRALGTRTVSSPLLVVVAVTRTEPPTSTVSEGAQADRASVSAARAAKVAPRTALRGGREDRCMPECSHAPLSWGWPLLHSPLRRAVTGRGPAPPVPHYIRA